MKIKICDLELVTVAVCLPKALKTKIDYAVAKRLMPGLNNRSALVEYALTKFLENLKMEGETSVPEPKPEPEKNLSTTVNQP